MSNSNLNDSKILLMGDLVRHAVFEPDKKNEKGPLMKATITRTGVGLLRSMIREALVEVGDSNDKTSSAAALNKISEVVIPVFHLDSELPLIPGSRELISVLDYFPQKSTGNQRDKEVLRVKEEYSTIKLTRHPKSSPDHPKTTNSYDPFTALLSEAKIGSGARNRILVIDDRDSNLRKNIEDIKDEPSEILQTLSTQSQGGGIVVAIRDNVVTHWLDVLKIKLNLDGETRKRTLVIVTADALRKRGLNITEYGSLEQAVEDVVQNLGNSPLKDLHEMSVHLVIIFRETGAVYLNMELGTGSINICPNFDRNSQADSRTFGTMPGKFTIMLAAIVRQLYVNPQNWNIEAALRLGVAGYNLHFQEGFNDNEQYDITNPFQAVEKALSLKKRNQLKSLTDDRKKPDFLITSLPFEIKLVGMPNDPWSRVDAVFALGKPDELDILIRIAKEVPITATPRSRTELETLILIRIVKEGLEKVFRSEPESKTEPEPAGI